MRGTGRTTLGDVQVAIMAPSTRTKKTSSRARPTACRSTLHAVEGPAPAARDRSKRRCLSKPQVTVAQVFQTGRRSRATNGPLAQQSPRGPSGSARGSKPHEVPPTRQGCRSFAQARSGMSEPATLDCRSRSRASRILPADDARRSRRAVPRPVRDARRDRSRGRPHRDIQLFRARQGASTSPHTSHSCSCRTLLDSIEYTLGGVDLQQEVRRCALGRCRWCAGR